MRNMLPLLAFTTGLLVLVPLARAGVTMTAPAPAPASTPPAFDLDSWWNGPSLTYDWFGEGATMRSNGVYLESDLSQYGQGLVSGKGNHSFDYGDKLDTYVHFV